MWKFLNSQEAGPDLLEEVHISPNTAKSTTMCTTVKAAVPITVGLIKRPQNP